MSKFSMKTVAIATVVGGAIAGALTASAALNLPTQNCSYVFNTNMKQGSRGADVKNLQVVLNAYSQTRVANSGAGSPGLETTTFGPATRAAVNKFQALQLAELGISAPTGNVFAGTRGLLNQICTGGNTTTTGTPGNPGTPVVTGPVTAALASSQPSGMIVAGQSGAIMANIVFSGSGTVTQVQLQRTGVSSDSSLTNVYLYDGNTRITDSASVVTGGFINFTAPMGLFVVNGSRTITVRADVAAGTAGQAIGVKLNTVTALGGTQSTYTNVVGNYLTVSGVAIATANLGALDQTAKTVDAGTTNYNVWTDSISIGTRNTLLRAATFKYVGSAPVDSVQNISLYVDGTKVAGPATVNAANNNKITFDLGATPFVLTSGSHTIDVRGDIIKGSSYNFYFAIENPADLMLEDSNLAGVNLTPTVNSATLTVSNSKFGTIGVNSGSVTVVTDPAFNPTTITGGATNMPIAQFTLKGYGEDVKVNTLQVTPVIGGSVAPYSGGLSNVSLFLNGGQIGTSVNFTGSALNFTLGSSLIIPAGQTVTLTVKADILNATNTVAYTAGTVTASIGGVASNAQGVTSNQLVSVAQSAVSDSALTIGTGAGSFSRTSGFVAQNVAPNTPGVKIGSFTVQAGSSEDVLVNSANVNLVFGGSPIMTYNNIGNIILKTGGVALGTPVGIAPSSGSSTFSFSDIRIPMNSTQIFDVFADLGSATGTVQADMGITARGAVSRISSGLSSAGVAMSPIQAVLASSTLVSNSPVSQFVIGGSSQNIATFKIKTSSGDATITKLIISATGTDAIVSMTVTGKTFAVVNNSVTMTGLSIPVSTTGTDVPVTVQYSGFKNSTSGGSMTTGTTTGIALADVEGQSGNGANITNLANVGSNAMFLYASKPTITFSSGNGTLSAGSVNIGTFTVAADANGAIQVATTSIVFSTSTGGSLNVTNVKLSDDNGATAIANSNTIALPLSGTAFQIGFTTPYQISAGSSKTFQIWATIGGSFGAVGTTQLTTQLDPTLSAFKWVDVVTGTSLTGTGIQNYPVQGYSLKN